MFQQSFPQFAIPAPYSVGYDNIQFINFLNGIQRLLYFRLTRSERIVLPNSIKQPKIVECNLCVARTNGRKPSFVLEFFAAGPDERSDIGNPLFFQEEKLREKIPAIM